MQNQNDNVVIVFNKSISLIEKFLNTKFYALQVPLSWKSRDQLFLGEKAAILPSGVHVTAVLQSSAITGGDLQVPGARQASTARLS